MTKLERVTKNIESNKELMKQINSTSYLDIKSFVNSADRYIKAIKEGRMICSIGSVSQSGMSRNIKFMECRKGNNRHCYLNFYAFFLALGHRSVGNMDGYFRVSGCGMNMIFHTNYQIIHRLHRLGFISKKQCSNLAQLTPSVI